MAGTYLPLAALLATAITLLLATSSAVPVAAAAADKYTGRMVIIRAPGARVLDVSAGGAALNKWQQRRRGLVEDEVAPEFGGGQLLGVGNDDSINSKGLDPDRQVCTKKPCAAPGEHYIDRPCYSKHYCVTNTPAG